MNESEDFLKELCYASHKGFNIPMDKMVITYPRSGSVLVTIAFGTEDYNNYKQILYKIYLHNMPQI